MGLYLSWRRLFQDLVSRKIHRRSNRFGLSQPHSRRLGIFRGHAELCLVGKNKNAQRVRRLDKPTREFLKPRCLWLRVKSNITRRSCRRRGQHAMFPVVSVAGAAQQHIVRQRECYHEDNQRLHCRTMKKLLTGIVVTVIGAVIVFYVTRPGGVLNPRQKPVADMYVADTKLVRAAVGQGVSMRFKAYNGGGCPNALPRRANRSPGQGAHA
jgi:hypothetical protein